MVVHRTGEQKGLWVGVAVEVAEFYGDRSAVNNFSLLYILQKKYINKKCRSCFGKTFCL